MTEDRALAVVEQETAITKADPRAFADAFDAYQQIQKIIDAKMPDQIMDIRGKKFRKKAYWRAVSTAFNLDCVMQSEKFIPDDGSGDWGYSAVYTATSPSGRKASGDGVCMASEKQRGEMKATHHNVRGHAHTRAFNRAISNLVGFGEVSADEINDDDRQEPPKRSEPKSQTPKGNGGEWDGQLKFKSGKHAGKRWADMNTKFLNWCLDERPNDYLVNCAEKEIARRAKLEATEPPDYPEPPPEDEPPF